LRTWLLWNGKIWQRDWSNQARLLARNVAVELFQQAARAGNHWAEQFANTSLNSRPISNMLGEAEAELAIPPAELDSHPDIVVFLNGEMNLRTGEFRPHNREHFITKMIKYNYVPGAQCPVFLRTLRRLFGGAAERMIKALQRAIGYSMTGHTWEKVVFIVFGSGNNGKTTILVLFSALLGDHAAQLQIDTLMVRQENSNSQADLAGLRGARFATTSETEEGKRFAEGKLKRITQGMGRIKATRKYENPIEFQETHKLWIDANHLPAISGTDNAIWNRLFLIPFTITIPPEEIDRELGSKLLGEAEGILAWAVQGAHDWYEHGLLRPAEVTTAMREYRAESDQLERFISARCEIGPTKNASAKDLHTAYRGWAEGQRETVMTSNMFGRRLMEREGITKRETAGSPRYTGIGVCLVTFSTKGNG